MKKLLLALSVASLFAAPAMAEEVEALSTEDLSDPSIVASTVSSTAVTLQGELVAPTCSIVANHQNQIVKLDKFLTTDIEGGETGKKSFNIDLERCPSVNKLVSLHLKVPSDKLDGRYLKNDFGGTKAGVSLKISHNGQEVDLAAQKGAQGIVSYNLNTVETRSYTFDVEYVKANDAGDNIAPGLVQATLPVEIIYK